MKGYFQKAAVAVAVAGQIQAGKESGSGAQPSFAWLSDQDAVVACKAKAQPSSLSRLSLNHTTRLSTKGFSSLTSAALPSSILAKHHLPRGLLLRV